MEEETTGQSRLFVILAIALIGLLVLGLLGIGGVFVIRQNLQEQAAISQPTPTLLIRLPEPTPTPVPVKPQPTNTPAPTPTNTPVVEPGSVGGEEAAVGSIDNNGNNGGQSGGLLPKPPTKAPGADPAGLPNQVPETGLGALEAVLIAIGLVGVVFIARRMRMSAS